jgi:hypothetical protein
VCRCQAARVELDCADPVRPPRRRPRCPSTSEPPPPDFTLKTQDEKDWKLSDQKGKNVVLMWYPLDW